MFSLHQFEKTLKLTVDVQREDFWIFIFLHKNKFPSKFLQTNKNFRKRVRHRLYGEKLSRERGSPSQPSQL